MNKHTSITSNPVDIIIVTALCFGMFIVASLQAVAAGFPSDPFTDASFYWAIFVEVALALAACGYLHARGFDLTRLMPHPTLVDTLLGIALYAASFLVFNVLLVLFDGVDATAQPIDEMVANASISFAPLFVGSLVNGFYEETFLVGYLQQSLQTSGAVFAMGFSLLIRVLYHLYQGPVGAVSVLAFGLILSLYYLRTRKLWPLIVCHILADLAGFSFS